MAYLYGASIQGIQGFIFESNKLKTIIGASEIVKIFDNIEFKKEFDLDKEPTILLQAAGNIRLKIDNETDARKIANILPKYIMQMAYGITVSQALVDIDNDSRCKNSESREQCAKKILENKLKAQRNKVTIPLDSTISLMQPAPKNARPAVEKDEKSKDFISRSTKQKLGAQKCDEYRKSNKGIYISEISKLSNKKSKVAIIHADGNGLGNIVRNYTGDDMAEFSKNLDEATHNAFDLAIAEMGEKFKYREVILGGDDLTMICDADFALEFTASYLGYFEKQTEALLRRFKNSIDITSAKMQNYDGTMTACAGVAFCHEKYPFHFAVDLAEALCKQAKERSGRADSCVMFHHNLGSYYDNWDGVKERELTIVYSGEHNNDVNAYSFDFGPYYINREDKARLSDLLELHKFMRGNEDAPLSGLREWIEELYDNHLHARTLLKRIGSNLSKEINNELNEKLKKLHDGLSMQKLIVNVAEEEKTPIFDLLQLEAVFGGKKYV